MRLIRYVEIQLNMNNIPMHPWKEVKIGNLRCRIIHALQMDGDYCQWSGENFWPVFSCRGFAFQGPWLHATIKYQSII